MKIIVQDFKTGKLEVEEVVIPQVKEGYFLIKNIYSLVSAGTERTTVETAKASLIGKALKRPDLAKQVLENIKKEGFVNTFKKVKTRLETKRALGYSSSGIVVNSQSLNKDIRNGDRVACAGGGYAVHSEYVLVPENLVVKLPENVDYEEGAFATIGAIALQGVRRADNRIGENVAVIGLGLIGMLTMKILNASGINTMGIDIDFRKVEFAKRSGFKAFLRNDESLINKLETLTQSLLFDSVIICASSRSEDPVNLASQLVRKKGKIVIVGNFPLNFERQILYEKEVDILMSTSYGPGRYDFDFEEKGYKYPPEYIRWTEDKNMESFLNLISDNKLSVKDLITHKFPIENGTDAYKIFTENSNKEYYGILIEYNDEIDDKIEYKPIKIIESKKTNQNHKSIAFIGAGNFAQSYLLPEIKKRQDISLKGVLTSNPVNSKTIAEKFGFEYSFSSINDITYNNEIGTIFITTRHDTHKEYLLKGLEKKKNIFLEKPLCINENEFKEIKEFIEKNDKIPIFTIGYNRRFAPSIEYVKNEIIGSNKIVIDYTINAGKLPSNHWLLDRDIGGGRLKGEFCHFIDLIIYFLGNNLKVKSAGFISENKDIEDFSVILYSNTGFASLTYTSSGSKEFQKETIKVFSQNRTFIIDNFNKLTIYPYKKTKRFKSKGYKEELDRFFDSLEKNYFPISINDLIKNCEIIFEIEKQVLN